ncbi:YaiI/YqxD family protein [Lachnospiraceae bacterium NSJ-143]|nr:YaiI/YqxD family protein [Lachnospiraceae bacterium NSJ-143]
MRVFIDADGCPVRSIAVNTAKKYRVPVTIVSDTCHIIEDSYCEIITVDKQSDSADYAIINRMTCGDVCITQDYGLAAMVLAKNCFAIHQNGFLYTSENIDSMLFERHISKKLRSAGMHSSKHKKRTADNDAQFKNFFENFLATNA